MGTFVKRIILGSLELIKYKICAVRGVLDVFGAAIGLENGNAELLGSGTESCIVASNTDQTDPFFPWNSDGCNRSKKVRMKSHEIDEGKRHRRRKDALKFI